MATKTEVSNVLLAAWLQENMPEVFAELARQANAPAAPGLSGFTDILSSIGSTIGRAATTVASGLSTAVKSVGSFIGSPTGQGVLASAGQLYAAKLQSDTQKRVLDLQIERARAGDAPAPIQTVYDATTGAWVPVMTDASGQQIALSSQALARLQPSFIARYRVWLAGAGIGGLMLWMLLRRR